MRKPVLIDTDAGVDDAMAIVLALRSPELDVRAITTVCGNVEVWQCTRNVRTILDRFGMDPLPLVASGAARPLRRRLTTAKEVHGRDGLGNVARAHTQMQRGGRNAVGVILEMCRTVGRDLTIVALGPLTNLALALKRNPKVLKRVGRVISMGGAFKVPGNTGPVAEFNYYVDPEAAHAVLNAGLPLVVVPLDVTHQVTLMRTEVLERAAAHGHPADRFLERMTRFYFRYHTVKEGFEGGYLHDPAAVACAIDPAIVRAVSMSVDVERRGEFTRGMTLGTSVRIGRGRPTVEVATHIDRERFLRLFHQRLWAATGAGS